MIFYLATWLLSGLEVAWNKAGRGTSLQWIGFTLTLEGPQCKDLRVELTAAKKEKLLAVLQEIQQCRGVIPVSLLQHSSGILGRVKSAIPLARPWLAMIWAAIAQKQEPQETNHQTSQRVGVCDAGGTCCALDPSLGDWKQRPGHVEQGPQMETLDAGGLQTDASPFGLGGTLSAYFTDCSHAEDFALFGSTRGDPAFQSEYEMLAMLVALRVFGPILVAAGCHSQVMLRSDNMDVVHSAMRFKAGSIMVQLTAKICLELEHLQLAHVLAQHVPAQ